MNNTQDKEFQTRACLNGIGDNRIYFILKKKRIENRANTYMISRDATYETIFYANCGL